MKKLAQKQNKQNIIVILTDDLGYGDIGVYGNPDVQTPNIDSLAHEGLLLNQHYSGAPLCAPARAALLTGRYHNRTGALSVESNRGMDRIALREKTVADAFKTAGYSTGMIGKWHNGLFDIRHHPNNRGFDDFFGFLNGGMHYYDWILDRNGTPVKSDGRYLTDAFTDEAINFIGRNKNNPFFLYLSYNTPHTPLEAPEEDIKPFIETGKFNKTVSTIYGMIKRMDTGVGKILETLKSTGIDDNTVILFTSDNGPWLGGSDEGSFMRYNGPFRGMKNYVLEGGIRVPAIVRWPDGLPQNRQINEMVHFVDWMPTLLNAAEIDYKSELPLDGLNVLPLLQGDRDSLVRTKLFWQHNRNEPVMNCNAAMRDGYWKIVWPYPESARIKSDEDQQWYLDMFDQTHFMMDVRPIMIEQNVDLPDKPCLYNIKKDPFENEDLSDKYPDRLNKMKLELENWFQEVEADRKKTIGQ